MTGDLTNDGRGLIWPSNVAPFDVHVIAAGKEDVIYSTAEALVGSLEESGFDVLFDDRPKASPGVKFGDAELLGVPLIVIVGRDAAEGRVEVWNRRTNERTSVTLDEVGAALEAT